MFPADKNAELVESFSAYSEDFQEYELEVWRRRLEVSTQEGITLESGEVTRTSDGHLAYARGHGFYEIPRLGITVLAQRPLGM